MNYAPQVLSKPLTPEQAIMYETGKKSVGIAILFGLLLTGGGQMYAGRVGRGFAFMGAQFAFLILSFVVIGIPFLIGTFIWSLFDAKTCVEQFNAGHLAIIASGQVLMPVVGQINQPVPRPLSPAEQQRLNTPVAPPSPAPPASPPPPSSSIGVSPAQPGNKITLSEDDF